MNYGFKKTVDLSYEEAIEKITNLLKDEGFGILTEIDVKKTLKEKLDLDTDEYIILGACNPSYAHKALEIERDLGLLLPCNVVVYRNEDKTIVGIVSPKRMIEVANNPKLNEIAEEVENKLKNCIEKIE